MSKEDLSYSELDEGSREAVGRVLGRGSIYTIATVIQLGAGIITIPVLTRIVNPDEYGTITAALVVQAVLGTAAAFGMPAAISRTYFRDGGPQAARALIGATTVAAVTLALIAELTGPLWSQVFDHLDYGAVLRLAVISAAPTAVLIAAQTALQAADRARAFVFSAAMATAGAQGLGLLLAASGSGATGYMAGVTVALAAAAGTAWVAAGIDLRALRRSGGGNELLGRAFAIGLPTIPHGLALYMLSAADRVVVERLDSLADAGAYYVAYAVGSLAIFLVAALNGAWGPILFGSEKGHRWSFLAESTIDVTRVVAPAAAALALGAPIALRLFAPSDYALSGLGSVSALVAASALPYLWYITSYNVIVWQARTSILAWATPLIAVVNVVLCVLLVPPMGLEGAALATLLAYILLGLLTWLRTHRLVEIPWDHRAIAFAALPAIVGVGAALILPDHGIWLEARGLAAAGFGAVAIAALTSHRRTAPLPVAG